MRSVLLIAVFVCLVAPAFAITAEDEGLMAQLIEEYKITETLDLTDIEATSAVYKSFKAVFNMRKAGLQARKNNAYYYNSTTEYGMCTWAATYGQSLCASYERDEIKDQVQSILAWSGGLPSTCQRRVMEVSCARCAIDAPSYLLAKPTLPEFPVTLCASYCRQLYADCSAQMTINGTRFINASSADELCANLNETNCYDGTAINLDGSVCPYTSSSRAQLLPLSLASPDTTCGYSSVCCDADTMAFVKSSIALVLDSSKYPNCYNSLVDASCAECDPNSGYWTNPVSEEPLVCKSICERRVSACAGATSPDGSPITNPTTCSPYPDSKDSKQCYAGSPRNSAQTQTLSFAVAVLSFVVVVALL